MQPKDPSSWFQSGEDDIDPNDPDLLNSLNLGEEDESNDDSNSSEDDSNNDSDDSQDDSSNSSQPPAFDPTAFGLPLDATPDSVREAFEYWQNRNNQQQQLGQVIPFPNQPPIAPSSHPTAIGVTPPQSFLGSGDAGEYDTDPRIAAALQQIQARQQAHEAQLLQAQHLQITNTTNSAVAAFQAKHDIDSNLMLTIRKEAANSGLLMAAMSNSQDPYTTIMQVLEATAFSNPILRDKILNKPDDKATEVKKQKLNALGGTSKSTRTAPKQPLSQQEHDAAFIEELRAAAFQN